MSRTLHHQRGDRRIRAKGIRRDPPDLRRYARALIALAIAQAETDALAQDNPTSTNSKKRGASPADNGNTGRIGPKDSA